MVDLASPSACCSCVWRTLEELHGCLCDALRDCCRVERLEIDSSECGQESRAQFVRLICCICDEFLRAPLQHLRVAQTAIRCVGLQQLHETAAVGRRCVQRRQQRTADGLRQTRQLLAHDESGGIAEGGTAAGPNGDEAAQSTADRRFECVTPQC